MSFHEGSKWQERMEDAKQQKSINDKKYKPENLSKKDLVEHTQIAIKSESEKEKYCQQLEKEVARLKELLREKVGGNLGSFNLEAWVQYCKLNNISI